MAESTAALLPAIANAPALSRNSTLAPRSRPSSSAANGHGRLVFAGVLVAHQVLAPILDPLHRAAQEMGREHDRDLLLRREHLEAERTPDVGHDDPHLTVVDAEHPREVTAHTVRSLRRDPDREVLAERIPARQRPASLHRHARHTGAGERSRSAPRARTRSARRARATRLPGLLPCRFDPASGCTTGASSSSARS